jgi:ubiquinone/menaquinone biosynthesis C-methylase UbiE
MLSHAKARADAAGLTNLSFHHGGFLSYRHAAAPVDVVVTRYALHHLSDFWKMAGLLRVAEMMKPGGCLYLEDVVFSFTPTAYQAEIEAWIGRVARAPGEGFTAQDFEAHVREEHSTFGWILEGMLTRAGFEICATDTTDPAYARYTCVRFTA